MKRMISFGAVVLSVLFIFSACDVSKLVGTVTGQGSSDDKASSSGAVSPVLESFTFKAADNAALGQDYTTLIAESGTVTAFLPPAVIVAGTPLEASYEIPAGTKITPDPRVDRPYTSGVTYTVSTLDDSTSKEYHIVPQSRDVASSAQALSFMIDSSLPENAHLPNDIIGSISDTTITLKLPQALFINNQLDLLPTITVTDGATIMPDGVQDFTNGMTFSVIGADGGATVYAVRVGVDPNTMTFLDVSDPFYVDGIPQDLSYTNLSSGTDLTLSVTADVWDVISGKAIGFNSYEIPYNATANLSAISSGAVPPYSVTVTSGDGAWSQEYTVDIDRMLPFRTDVIDGRILYKNAYKVYRQELGFNRIIIEHPGDIGTNYIRYKNGVNWNTLYYNTQWAEIFNYIAASISINASDIVSFDPTPTFTLHELPYPRTAADYPIQTYYTGMLYLAYVASENTSNTPENSRWVSPEIHGDVIAKPMNLGNVISFSHAAATFEGKDNSSPFEYEAGSHTYFGGDDATSIVSSDNYVLPDWYADFSSPDSPWPDNGQIQFYQAREFDITARWFHQYRHEYTSRNFMAMQAVEITGAPYAEFANFTPGALATTWSTGTSGTSEVLTINLQTSADNKLTGEVATFDLVAESGDRESYTVRIYE